MAAVMLFLQQTTGKTERHTHFCMPLEPVFTRDCGGRVHFTDEPTGNLDSKSGKVVIDALDRINQKYRKTIVMVTHDPQMASHCTRIILLRDGRILGILKKEEETEKFYQEILARMAEL